MREFTNHVEGVRIIPVDVMYLGKLTVWEPTFK